MTIREIANALVEAGQVKGMGPGKFVTQKDHEKAITDAKAAAFDVAVGKMRAGDFEDPDVKAAIQRAQRTAPANMGTATSDRPTYAQILKMTPAQVNALPDGALERAIAEG